MNNELRIKTRHSGLPAQRSLGEVGSRISFRISRFWMLLRLTRMTLLRDSEIGSSRGFTFIELILYISIVTIMLSALIPFAWDVIGGGVKSSAEQEVFSQARYISERLKYEIRNAKDIDSPNSNFDINLATDSTKKLMLTQKAPTDTYEITVTTAGLIQIKPGNADAFSINSTDTKVTDLTFTNYTSTDNKTKHVGFTLTVTANFSTQRQEFKETLSLRSSSEVRGN